MQTAVRGEAARGERTVWRVRRVERGDNVEQRRVDGLSEGEVALDVDAGTAQALSGKRIKYDERGNKDQKKEAVDEPHCVVADRRERRLSGPFATCGTGRAGLPRGPRRTRP